MRAAALLLLPLLLAGCASRILEPSAESVRGFSCAMLDPVEYPLAAVEVATARGVVVGLDDVLREVQVALQEATGRTGAGLVVRLGGHPRDGDGNWSAAELREWGLRHPYLEDGEVRLTALLVPRLWDPNLTGTQVAPGAVAVSAAAVAAGAAATGQGEGDVLRALLLHHFGHALGTVNAGIPVSDATLHQREGPPRHEPDPASVMDVGWEDVRTMAWSEGADYGRYSGGVLKDLRLAAGPAGVCA